MSVQYSAKIIENGKARYAECSGCTPGDALLQLVGSDFVQYLTAKPE